MIKCVLCSQLSRVFIDRNLDDLPELTRIDALPGERVSFQAAYQADKKIPADLQIEIEAAQELLAHKRIRRVGNTVVEFLSNAALPENRELGFENFRPGLYPDPLREDLELAHACPGSSYAFFVELTLPENLPAGEYLLQVRLHNNAEKDSASYQTSEVQELKLYVGARALAPERLRNTHWFYCDCICRAHDCEMFSERFWTLLEKYFCNMIEHGINMILTPIFTPPLDTAPGSERMSCQLVKIRKNGAKYSFDFKLLRRWVELAQKCGMKYFEMSHLFTQWGAKFTPKIEVQVNGRVEKLFGWHQAATSPEYKDFLDQFLPALKRFLGRSKIAEVTYFHVSDEPWDACLESYQAATELVKNHLRNFKIIDAASHAEFFTRGIVELPVVGESEMDKFADLPIKERWTYYCGGHELPCSNRLHTMPLAANRIIGVLLYIYKVEGFLHWGYNFWNSGLSRRFCQVLSSEVDWDYNSGDGYLVYPGADGPLDSQRYEVFYQGLQDLRALNALEAAVGREAVVALINRVAGMSVKMDKFPLDNHFPEDLRREINQLLAESSTKKH